MVITWLVIRRKRPRHDLRCFSSRGRQLLHALGLGPSPSGPTEADGVPVESRPMARSIRVLGGQLNELPAHEYPTTSSRRSSIVDTPTRMYLPGNEAFAIPYNVQKDDPYQKTS